MKYKYLYTPKLINYARNNRVHSTNAEKVLWFHLRKRQIMGLKFRRQFPIDNYILDFYCLEKKIGIELDGSQHVLNNNYDNRRSQRLQSYGISVIRFWDNDVLMNTDTVLEEIIRVLNETSP